MLNVLTRRGVLAAIVLLAFVAGAPTAGATASAAHHPAVGKAHHAAVKHRHKTKHRRHAPVKHAKHKHKPAKKPARPKPAVPLLPPTPPAPVPPAPVTPIQPPTGTGDVVFAGRLIDEESPEQGEGFGSAQPYAEGNCTRYAWTKRQDLPGNLGNAATWDERAAAQGFPVDTTPRSGDVGVAEANQNGAYGYGHVFYVERINEDGSLFVSEMNVVGFNQVSTRTIPANRIAGLHFIHPKGPAPTPPTPNPGPAPDPGPTVYPHHVVGTCGEGACGLKKRSGPGFSAFAQVGVVYDGNQIDIVCQVMGETVRGRNATSAVWDRLSDGSYVSDYYTDTPNVGTWSPPIARC